MFSAWLWFGDLEIGFYKDTNAGLQIYSMVGGFRRSFLLLAFNSVKENNLLQLFDTLFCRGGIKNCKTVPRLKIVFKSTTLNNILPKKKRKEHLNFHSLSSVMIKLLFQVYHRAHSNTDTIFFCHLFYNIDLMISNLYEEAVPRAYSMKKL